MGRRKPPEDPPTGDNVVRMPQREKHRRERRPDPDPIEGDYKAHYGEFEDKPPKGTAPGTGYPAVGEGWGGPSRNEMRALGVIPPILTKAQKAERVEQMKDVLYDIATNPKELSMIRVMAAEKLMDREIGKAKAMVEVKDTSDLEDWVSDSYKESKKPDTDVA